MKSGVVKLPVQDGESFLGCDSIVIQFSDPDKQTAILAIDISYSLNGFIKGIKTGSGSDTVRLQANSVQLSVEDKIYPFVSYRFYKKGFQICKNNDKTILADDVDSFKVVFKTRDGTVTTDWNEMFYVSMNLTIRGQNQDYSQTSSDENVRRVSVGMDFRLKNRM